MPRGCLDWPPASRAERRVVRNIPASKRSVKKILRFRGRSRTQFHKAKVVSKHEGPLERLSSAAFQLTVAFQLSLEAVPFAWGKGYRLFHMILHDRNAR